MMGSGDNINNVIRTGSMDDIGSRLQFLTELYELWQEGIEILDKWERNTPFYAEKRKELEIASRLLMYHMEKDYKEEVTKKMINDLPAFGDQIKDEGENK
jgi:hypothetical protein